MMLQIATPLRKSVPWPSNISDGGVFCNAPATRHAWLQIFFNCPVRAIIFATATKPARFAMFCLLLARCTIHRACDLRRCFVPQRRALFGHLNFQKWSEHVVLLAFWLRNVGVHFLNTPIFKSALKCSEAEMFSAFWRRTVLRVTAARTYSTPQLPKVLWGWGAFTIFTYFYIE